jgi:hypothetical protein
MQHAQLLNLHVAKTVGFKCKARPFLLANILFCSKALQTSIPVLASLIHFIKCKSVFNLMFAAAQIMLTNKVTEIQNNC